METYEVEVFELRKEVYKNNASQMLMSNQFVNTVVFDGIYDDSIVDYSNSRNIYLDKHNHRISLVKHYNEGVILTNEITPSVNTYDIDNVFVKVYGCIPYGSDIQAYIVVDGQDYPTKLVTDYADQYIKLPNVKSFKLKIKLTRNANNESSSINSFAIFFEDKSVM